MVVPLIDNILDSLKPTLNPLVVIFGLFFVCVSITLFLFIRQQKKLKDRAYVLYFYGKDECELVKISDKNLSGVKIEDGIYDLSKTKPKTLKIHSFLGSGKFPLFKVKKDIFVGLDIYSPDYVEIEQDGKYKISNVKDIPAKLEPKVVRKTIESKIFQDFAKSSLDAGFNWLNFLLGIGAGVIGYMLVTGLNII